MEITQQGILCRPEHRDFDYYCKLFDEQYGSARHRVSGRVINLRCLSGIFTASFSLRPSNLEEDPRSLKHDALVRILLKKEDILLHPKVNCYGNGIVTGNLVSAVLSPEVPNGREANSVLPEFFPITIRDYTGNSIYFFEKVKNPDIHD